MNTKWWLVKYEPLHIITLFNKKQFYVKSSKINELLQIMQSNKFVTIKDNIINTSSIDIIEPASDDINQVENKLIDLNKETAERIRQEVYLRKTNNSHKQLTDWVLENIINKFTS